MTLHDQIEKDYILVYKAKDKLKLSVLRLLKSAMKNMQVELRIQQTSLSDEQVLDIILNQAKQRQDSIEQFRNANRHDLADKEASELVILQEYLPASLSEEEVEAAINAAIAESAASKPQEMGKVMAIIMQNYKGRIDGKKVSSIIRQKLSQ